MINQTKSIIFVCYRAPRVDPGVYFNNLSLSLDRALLESDNIIVIGDLNQNMKQLTQSQELVSLCDSFGLSNLIKTETCYKNPNNKTIVDVILSNNPGCFSTKGTIVNGLSDFHHMIYGAIKSTRIRQPARQVIYRSYKNFVEDDFNDDLESAPFHVGGIFDDMDDKYWYFQTLLNSIVETHAPLKSKKVRPVQPPFMNSCLRSNTNRKAQLRGKYNDKPTNRNWEIYRKQRNRTTAVHKHSVKNYFTERCSGKQDSKFYQTVKPFISSKPSTPAPSQLKEENNIISDLKEISEIMNVHYTNIADKIGPPTNGELTGLTDQLYVNECTKMHQYHPGVSLIRDKVQVSGSFGNFSFHKVSEQEIRNLISKSNPKKSTGHDMIPPKILKLGQNNLVSPITSLVNSMIESSIFPGSLKMAEISPLYKKQSHLEKANFRPVSVLPAISKLFEKPLEYQLKDLGAEFSVKTSQHTENISAHNMFY